MLLNIVHDRMVALEQQVAGLLTELGDYQQAGDQVAVHQVHAALSAVGLDLLAAEGRRQRHLGKVGVRLAAAHATVKPRWA